MSLFTGPENIYLGRIVKKKMQKDALSFFLL